MFGIFKLKFGVYLLFGACYLVLLSSSAHAGTIIRPPAYLGLSNGLVGCWTFDGSYTKVPDCSGNNNTGTLTNGPTQTIGKVGQALNFDGSNDYVEISDSASIEASRITVSAWVKGSNFGSSYRVVALRYTPTVTWDITFLDNVLKWHVSSDGSSWNLVSGLGTKNLADNTWHYVVGVYDGTKGYVYVDGVLDTSGGSAGSIITTGTSPIHVGAYAGGSAQHLNGQIDEVRVYNRALSAGEIKRLYNIGLGSTANRSYISNSFDQGLVGHWTFDGSDIGLSGTQAKDRSGNNNHGTLTNGPTQTIGKVGQALNFDGSNDYVNVPDATNLRLTNFTVSAWIRSDTAQNGVNLSAVVRKGISANDDENYLFLWDHSNSNFQQAWSFNSGVTWYNAKYTTVLRPNIWYHIVGTHDGSNLKAYLNGALEKTTTTGVNPDTGAGTFRIGAIYNGTQNFDGQIDEVRVYNRALSAGEIKRLYDSTQSKYNSSQTDSLTQGLVGHWTFDGSDIGLSGTQAKDRSGNKNHGTLTNGPIQAVGKVGQALDFDGSNDRVVSSANIGVSGATARTVSLWANATSVAAGSKYLFSWGADTNLAAFSTVFGTTTAGNVFLYFNGRDWQAGSGTVSANTWYHVVVTYNGGAIETTDSVILYINGTKTTITSVGVATGNLNTTNAVFNTGVTIAQNASFFPGTIDEVRVYNRALSAGEVNKLYQMGR